MYNISVNDKDVTFKALEKEIYKYTCETACKLLQEVLEKLDKRLMDERDTKVYREKGFKHTCIKTIMGPVEVDRRIYEYRTEEGRKAYKFLLDEFLHMDTLGHISANLVESIVKNATEVSYRKTSENVELMTNQNISHTAVWNVIQKVGSWIEKKEDRKIELFDQDKLKGEKEIDVVFQEQDGIWLNIQGKDKPKKGKNKKKELKLAISYEGWEKRNYKKEEYTVVNKIACASFEGSKKFKKLSEATIAGAYDMDEIKTRIINGDGASWIKASLGEEGVHFQLDPFHKSQAVLRAVRDKSEAKKLIDMLNQGNTDDSLNMITDIMIRDSSDDNKLKKLEVLYNYLVDNKEGLIPYHLREDIKLPEPPQGIVYRHLGTMEHNICDILAQRMKGRKMSWSISGGQNLAKILATKFSNQLYDVLDEVMSNVITDEQLSEILEVNTLSAAKLNKKRPKSNISPLHRGELPFTGSALTNGRKAIRSLLNYKEFSQMLYK